MGAVRISCVSCGAPVTITSDTDSISCTYCGTILAVQRSEGHVTLRLAEKVNQAVQQVGAQTLASIRESTHITQLEIQRLQLSQELSAAQMQLSGLQQEIRSLERQRANGKTRKQLRELRIKEMSLIARIEELQASIARFGTSSGAVNVGGLVHSSLEAGNISSRDWLVALLLCICLGFLGIHRFYTGHIVIGMIQLLTVGGFGIWWLVDLILILANRYRDKNGHPLRAPNVRLGHAFILSILIFIFLSIFFKVIGVSDIGIVLALIVGVVVFIYKVNPQAKVWRALARILSGHKRN